MRSSLPDPAATYKAPAPVYLTARQLMTTLSISRRTLTTWVRRGVIPSVCIGRVRRYELGQVQTALRAHEQRSSEQQGLRFPELHGKPEEAEASSSAFPSTTPALSGQSASAPVS